MPKMLLISAIILYSCLPSYMQTQIQHTCTMTTTKGNQRNCKTVRLQLYSKLTILKLWCTLAEIGYMPSEDLYLILLADLSSLLTY